MTGGSTENHSIDKDAISLFQSGKFASCLSFCRDIIAGGTASVMILRIAGKSAAALGDPESAICYFRDALNFNNSIGEIHTELGIELQNLGRLEEAETALLQGARLSPSLMAAHANLGLVRTTLRKFEEAEQAYRTAISIEPNSAILYSNLAKLYIETGRYADAAEVCQQAIQLAPDFAPARHNLASIHRHQGQHGAAAESYREALRLDPGNAQSWSSLGSVLLNLEDLSGARDAYQKALEIEPDDPDAIHMTASIDGETADAPPDGYVRSLFDDYARKFENHLTGTLEYRLPEILETAIKSYVASHPDRGERFARLLDLGCGTGLVGKYLHPYAHELVGVDLSPNMLEIADRKGVYTELWENDVLAYLNSAANRSFDLITAADVFIYVGALTDIFQQVARVLQPNGLFVFSTEKLEIGTFEVSLSGRYKHSRAHLEDLANRSGFTLARLEELTIRQEFGNSIEGYLVCLEI